MLFQELDEINLLYSQSFESQIGSLVPSLIPQIKDNDRSLVPSFIPQIKDNDRSLVPSFIPQIQDNDRSLVPSFIPQIQDNDRSLVPSFIPQIQDNDRSLLFLPMKEISNDNVTIEIKSTSQDNILKNIINKKQTKLLRRKRKALCIEIKKFHSKFDKDNILRTMQVHFITFIVNYINEILSYFGFKDNDKFYQISYNFKKNIKKSVFNDLKNNSIGNVLRQKISSKYKKDEDTNIKLYDKLINNDIIKEFLSENYINLFNKIYYKNKKEIKYGDKNIYLSKDVKTFEDFVNNKKYDDLYRERIIKAVENNFLPPKVKFITTH